MQDDGPADARSERRTSHLSARDGGVAITPADIAVGRMLLELCDLGVIEEAEVHRRLQTSGEIDLLEHLLEYFNQLRAE